MTGSEKRLRDRARGLAAIDPDISAAMEGDLDALLAEHRAEVEHLTEERAEAERFRDSWRRRWSEDVGATRNAALEEAGVAAKRRLYELGLSASLCCQAADIIRAMKSQPARPTFAEKRAALLVAGDPDPTTGAEPARQYVDARRVWEVHDELLETAGEIAATDPENPAGLIRSTVMEFVKRLGVGLDAEGEHPNTQLRGAQIMRSIEHTVREHAASEADLYEQGGFIPPEGTR